MGKSPVFSKSTITGSHFGGFKNLGGLLTFGGSNISGVGPT